MLGSSRIASRQFPGLRFTGLLIAGTASLLLGACAHNVAETPALQWQVNTVEATEGSIVIVRVGNDFMVKKLHVEQDGQIWLLSENPAYPPFQITEGMDFEVWGRVMNTIDFL